MSLLRKAATASLSRTPPQSSTSRTAAESRGAHAASSPSSATYWRGAPGRQSDEEITAFDSTGLAIQDLALALAAVESADSLDLPIFDL
jgi:hypothetical protein